jgi:hypothetical protein
MHRNLPACSSSAPSTALHRRFVIGRLAAAGRAPQACLLLLLAACASAPPAPGLERRTAVLSGTLLFENGAPAGAVRLRLYPGGSEVASGEQGQFEWTLLEPGERIVAFCGGGVEPGVAPQPVSLGAGSRLQVKLTVKRAAAATATCEAAFAAAAKGEPIGSWSRQPPREPLAPLRPIRAGALPKDGLVQLRGLALDASSAPLQVRVQLRRADEEPLLREGLAGPDGRFTLEGLEPGRYDLEALGPSGTQVVRGLFVPAGRPRDVLLRFGARRSEVRVRGRVLSGGKPVPGARLVAALGQGAVLAAGPVHAGPDGRFDLAIPQAALAGGAAVAAFVDSVHQDGGQADGRLWLYGSAEGGFSGAEVLPHTESAELTGDLELGAVPARRLCSGAVTFPDGSPAKGVTLTASPSRSLQAQPAAAVSDERGRFQLACTEGTAVLRARLGPAVALAEVPVPSEGAGMRLGPSAALRVKVSGKLPLKRLVVRALAIDDAEPAPLTGGAWRRAESEGEPVEFDGLPVGRPVEFTVQADDGSPRGAVAQGSVVLPGAALWEVEVAAE